jgi:hypothetical protein
MDWVTESRMAQLCGLARSTWQSWIRELLFELPPTGVFGLSDCLEVAIVSAIREHFSLPETKSVWESLRRSGDAERLLLATERLKKEGTERFDLVIDPALGGVNLAVDEISLSRAILDDERPRTVSVVPLAPQIRRIKVGFAKVATSGEVPSVRRGRPRRTPAPVIELRSRR